MSNIKNIYGIWEVYAIFEKNGHLYTTHSNLYLKKVNVGGKGMVIQSVFIPPNMNGQGTLKMGTVHSKF